MRKMPQNEHKICFLWLIFLKVCTLQDKGSIFSKNSIEQISNINIYIIKKNCSIELKKKELKGPS